MRSLSIILAITSNTVWYIEGWEDMVIERLQAIYAMYGRLLDNIPFYRDGVSECQYDMVKDAGFKQIENACRIAALGSKKSDYEIKTTLLV